MAITLDGTNGVTAPDLTVDTDTLTVDATNNRVGIGTSSPEVKLHVTESGLGLYLATFQGNLGTNNGRVLRLKTPSSDSSSEPFTWQTGNSVAWQIDADEAMRLDSSGNVGIGTSSPSQKLEVNGAVQANSGVVLDETNLHYLYNAGVGMIGIRFNSGATALGYMWLKDFGGSTRGMGVTSGNLAFATASTERMRIASNGWVGIGDSTPDAAMDVVGNIHYTGTISDVSDRRLKENVLDLSDSLNKVCQLNAKSYTLIADRDNEEEEVELGFIAQEVQTVFPEVVKNIQKYVVDENGENTEEEINYLGVSYIQLVAPMVEAIKELKTEVDNLKAKVTALEAGA